MWKTVLFALLVATASAEYGWKPNSEYRYEVHSKTLTSLNQVSDLYNGMIMKAQVVITPKTAEHLSVQIPQAEYSHVQMNLPEGPETHVPQENLKYQAFPVTKQPFEVKLKNGVVDEIVVSKEVPIWEVNVIKSIVSQLQVDTQGQRLIPSKLNTVPQSENEMTAVYKIMEDTVEGECEVLYDISPLPKYVLQRMPELAPQPQLVGHGQFINIVKTKNFTNCIHRPEYHFGLPGMTEWEPSTNRMGNFLSRSSVTRVVASGNLKSYTIQSSVTTNKVILSPEIYNNQKGEVFSRVNLTLNSVHSSQGQTEECRDPQTIKKLVYDFNSPWTNDQEARNRWDQNRVTREPGNLASNEEKYLKRHSRAITRDPKSRKQYGSSSSSESSESYSVENWHQETPTMTHAPGIPFLPYFVGYNGHSIQHSKEVNVNKIVKKLCEEMGQELQESKSLPERNTLDRFTMLTRIVQTMNVKQLQQATQELYVKVETESDKPIDPRGYSWIAFRDAVVQSGTGPALTVIKEWILSGQVHGEQAAQIVATLPKTVVFPNVEYMKSFFELVKNEKVLEHEYLNTSVPFAFATLVRKAQVDRSSIHNLYPVHTFGRPTQKQDKVVVSEFIPYFAQKLQHAVEQKDTLNTQLYIRVLGTMAHPKILRVFEPYLEGKKHMNEYERTLIVVSLAKLARTHPRLARSVLYKIYANIGEKYPVRVAAVYNLMRTNPPASIIQRMARFTHEDPSHQVTAAVSSLIRSISVTSGKGKKEQRENALSAVHLLTPKKYGMQYSYSNVTDYIVSGLNLGYTQYINYIGSESSLIPQSIFYHLARNVNGFKYVSNKFSGMVSSVGVLRDLLDDMIEIEDYIQQDKITTTQMSETLQKVYNTLHVQKTEGKELEVSALFEWLGTTRLATFDRHSLRTVLTKFMDLIKRCQNKRTFNYQKIYNEYSVIIGMPTASGFPFVYTLNTPTLVSVGAKVLTKTPNTTPKGNSVFVVPENYAVETELSYQYSSRVQSKIGFITPFDHQHYLSGFDKNTQIYLPINVKAAVSTKNNQVKVQISNPEQGKPHNILHFSTWPYVTRHNILEFTPPATSSTTKHIKVAEPKKTTHKIGVNSGLGIRVECTTERRFLDFKTVYDYIKSHSLVSLFTYPTQDVTIQHSMIDVILDPASGSSNNLVLTGTYLNRKDLGKQGKTAPGTGIPKPASTEVNTQDRAYEFLQRVSSEVKEAEPTVIDLGVEMHGEKVVQYITTLAYASSPIDMHSRFLMYFRKVSEGKNYEVCVNTQTDMAYLPRGNAIKAVEVEPKAGTRVQVYYGEQCQGTNPQIEIIGKFKRTPERKNYIQGLPLYQQAAAEQQQGYTLRYSQKKIVEEAKILDNYHFVMKYQHLPEPLTETMYKFYGYVRHVLYPYVSEDLFSEHIQPGQAEMNVHFSPDLKSLTANVHTPIGGITFQDVRVPRYVSKFCTPRRPYETLKTVANEFFRGQYRVSCNFDHNVVKTFGNATYNLDQSDAWHVAMITRPRFNPVDQTFNRRHVSTVLVRDVEGGQKEFMIGLETPENFVVGIVPEQGKVVVTIKGEKIPVTMDKVHRYQIEGTRGTKYTLVKFFQNQAGEVVLDLPQHGIQFLYLGKSARISVGPKNMNHVVGLCGTRGRYEFVTPKGYVVMKPKLFSATWALETKGSISKYQTEAQEYSAYTTEYLPANVVSEQDAGRANLLARKYENLAGSGQDYDSTSSSSSESNESRMTSKSGKKSVDCYTKRIVSIEKDNKHCFSLNPEPACTAKCHPVETATKTGEFHCVEKSTTSDHWRKMILRGANPDFRNKGDTEQITFEYPVKCVAN